MMAALSMRLNSHVDEFSATAQLAALRRQIDQHFMYDTLNAIACVVRDRKDAAVSTSGLW